MASSAPATDSMDATIAAFTPMSMNRLAELMLKFYIERPISFTKTIEEEEDDEDEFDFEDEDEDEDEGDILMTNLLLQFRSYMEDISTDPRAIGTEKGRQLYQAMTIVGLEDTAWAIEFISKAMYAMCLLLAIDEKNVGNESFGSKKEVRLWFKGMIGYLEEKLEEEECDVSGSMESGSDEETQIADDGGS